MPLDGPSADLPAAIDMGLAAELAASRTDVAIKAKALATLEAAHSEAVAAMQSAEAAVVAAVDALFLAEDIEAARQVAHHMDEAHRLGRALLHLAVANEMDGRHVPQEAADVLQRLDVPLLDRRTIAVNLSKYGDQAAAKRCAARRAALIAGEATEEVAAA